MQADPRGMLFRDPWFVAGISLLSLITLFTALGIVLWPHDPHDISFSPLSPPSAENWLGINDGGMDILAELFLGLANTIFFALVVAVSGLAVGAAAGLASGWRGGLTDRVLMRTADIFLAVPAVMILILVASFFRPSAALLALTLASFAWARTAKLIRAQTLVVKESQHVKAARRMGGSHFYIITRHLAVEIFPLYLIGFAALVRMAVFMEASLAFLGLFDPSRKSLGIMIRHALNYYYLDVWANWLLPPLVCLILLIMSSTFLALSLEKVFDPRLKGAA